MFFSRKPPKSEKPSTPPLPERNLDRRRTPRFETVIVSCSLGDLKDLSRSGARVHRTGAPSVKIGDTIELELSSPTDSLTVKARVVRLANAGRGRCEIGLAFDEQASDKSEAIENLAKHGTARGKGPPRSNADTARRLVASLRLPDHYAALGLSPGSSDEEIHLAFRSLARRCHPDVNKDPEAARTFCAINDAHRVLGDPERRAAYDRQLGLRDAA